MVEVIVLKDFFDKVEKINRSKSKKFKCSKERADYLINKKLVSLSTSKNASKNKLIAEK